MPTKKTRPKVQEFLYSATFDLPGELLTFEADSVEDCLEGLIPKLIKSKGVLTIRKADKEFSLILYPFQIRRFSVNKIYRQILGKRFTLALQ